MDLNENKTSNNEEPISTPISIQEEVQHPKKLKEIIFITTGAISIIAALVAAFYFSNRRHSSSTESSVSNTNNQSQSELRGIQSEFSYSECKGGDDMFPEYIKEIKWEDDQLMIKAISNQNCAVKNITGKSELSEDNSIILTIEGSRGLMMAMCNCDYETEFKLKGLQKTNYQVVLKNGEKETDRITFNSGGIVSDECDQDRSYSCYQKSLSAIQFPQVQKNIEERSNNHKEKEIVYDTPENKRIAESDSDFLRLLKKHEHYEFESDSYEKIYLSYDKETKNIKFGAGYYDGDDFFGATSWLVSEDISSFQEGVDSYVAEKKSLESPNSLEMELRNRLGIEITRAHENDAGFDFVYQGENITYRGPFEGYSQEGSLDFPDRDGANIFRFLDGFPQVSLLDNAKLMNLIDVSNKVYQPVKNNNGIDLSSIYDFTIKQSEMKARFFSKTNTEVENSQRHMTIHSFDIVIKDPVQKRYELNISSGELSVLTGDENVDEF